MQLLSASLDDLVFEGRNQAYGAYQLRRDYGQHLASASGITLGICALLLGGWLAWPAAQPKPVATNHVKLELTEVVVPPPVIEKPKQAVLAPPPAAVPPRTHAAPAIPTAVAPDHLVSPPPKPLTEVPIDLVDGPVGPPTLGPSDPLASSNTITKGGMGGESAGTTPGSSETFTYVEKMPEFAGGQAALMRYLRDHLRYPSQALREQAEGQVFMTFVVRADGTIAEATVLKGLGYGLDEEALRVVRQMPAWTPGYQAQHPVAVRFTLPITFKIQ